MSNKLILPFSTNKSKNNKTFRLLSNKELTQISKQKGRGILNIIKKTVLGNVSNNINSNNKNNKINFMKASNTKKYYETIKNKKSGGYLKEVLFPTGLSAATTVLGLTALQHTISKMNNKKIMKKKTSKK
jgi:hypothetical protein